ncbi:MAG: hypothetical protein ACON4U_11550 [Myxococcota bacterium]
MLGTTSLILSLMIACEGEPDTTEVDQALEQFEPKGPTFQDRVDDVKRRIGTGLEVNAIEELNGILGRRASDDQYWRMVFYVVRSAQNTAEVKAAIESAENIKADDERFQAIQLELAHKVGDWPEIIKQAQTKDSATAAAWIVRSILSGEDSEQWIGELPIIEEKPKRRKTVPPEEPVLPDVSPEVALYRLISLDTFPEGHQVHYQQLADGLSGTEMSLLRAELAIRSNDIEKAKSIYFGLLETDDLLLKQRILCDLIPILFGDEQAKVSEEALTLSVSEGNADLGNKAFKGLVDAWSVTGQLGQLPGFITEKFDEKDFTFKNIKPGWVHYMVAMAGLRGGAFVEALPFAQKLRLGDSQPEIKQFGAELETLLAIEAGQWDYIQKMFFPSTFDEEEGEGSQAKAESQDKQTKPEVPQTEENEQSTDTKSEDSDTEETYELTELQQVLVKAYRGEGQSVDWSLLDGYSDDLRLHIIMSLSRRGLTNTKELLSKQPQSTNIIDSLSVDYRLLEMAVDSGDQAEALIQTNRLIEAYGQSFPNFVTALRIQQLVMGEQTEGFNDPVTSGLWSALSNPSIEPGTCEYSFCAALEALNGLNTLGKEQVVRQTQLVWEQLPLHRKGIFSTGTSIDGSDGLDFPAQIMPLVGETEDHFVGLTISFQELERRRDHFRQNAQFGLNPIYGLNDEMAAGLLSSYHQVRRQMMGFYAGGVFPGEAFEVLSNTEKEAFTGHELDRIKPLGRVDIFGLQERLGRVSLLSYSEVADNLIGAVISPESAAVYNLGSSEEIRTLQEQHFQAHVAALGKDSFDHTYGHQLRQRIYDPFDGDLRGYGRYIVVAPEYFYQTTFMTLPEQQDGLLSLERNRTITYLPSLYEINKSASEFGPFESDIVGFARPLKTDASVVVDPLMSRNGQPAEVEVAKVHFRPDSRYIYVDDKVTSERYLKRAFTSRFLFLSGLEGSSTGGWLFDDGELTISEIQSKPTVLQTVFIGYHGDFEQQFRRVRAFMNAGARTVVVPAWEVPQPELHTYLRGIFEGLTRDDPLPASLKLGRKELLQQRLRESEDGQIAPNPSIWGSFIVFGQP